MTTALVNKTPYKAIYKKKPDIWKQAAGVKQRGVLGKQTVTIEHSVRFLPNEPEIVVQVALLEGEQEMFEEVEKAEGGKELATGERLTSPTSQYSTANEEDAANEPEEPVGGQGMRVRKESAYMKRLRAGEGVASNLPRAAAKLPQELQVLPPAEVEDEGEKAGMSEYWEMVGIEDYAFASVMGDAENLTPTFAEAKRCSDWPKWEQAIKAKLSSLKKNSTWEIVNRYDVSVNPQSSMSD
ncbi:hypothetical protein C0991_002675 [Blastosporella zonata]|nr:hypothetical protein C0991_002675 [Blastosporella zonata]